MSSDLKTQRDRFVAFSFAAADVLVELDAGGVIRFAAGACHDLFGTAAEALIGQPAGGLFAPEDRVLFDWLRAEARSEQRFGPFLVRLLRGGAPGGWASLHGCAMRGAEAERIYLTLSIRPAAGREEGGPRDARTGLYDSAAFVARAVDGLRQVAAQGRAPDLLLVEIAGIEDMPEAVADGVLGVVGAALRAHSRADIAGRLGPMRFAIADPVPAAAELAPALRATAARHAPAAARLDIRLRSLCLDAPGTPEDTARMVVYALGRFAEHGAEGFDLKSLRQVSGAMMEEALARVACFRSALAARDLHFVFQPVIALTTRRAHHHEMLVRFGKGESPFATLRSAEQAGAIHELDLLAAQAAIAGLNAVPPKARPWLAVNLSSRSLQSELFVATLERLLAPHASLRNRLMFEVTEGEQIAALESANRAIQRLRRLGHQVGLDDFGSGAASFQYLEAFDIDYVKLDGKHVWRLPGETRAFVMMKALVGLCRDLRLRVVAEMVETEAQLMALREIGVEFGQGYLFGRPSAAFPNVAVDRVLETQAVSTPRRGGW